MAIGIKVKKAPKDYYLGASKFFGAPTVPLAWEGDFYEDEIFLCQINLENIAHLDKENRLRIKVIFTYFYAPKTVLTIWLQTLDILMVK